MATAKTGTPIALRIERTLAHPREKVFAAWTDPTLVSRWFAPSDDFTVVVDRLDPRVNGEYRIEMRHSDGRVHIVVGKYLEVTPPSRLRFTWAWESDPSKGDTVVTIELANKGGGTELVLTHERFPSEESRDKHQHGWTGCLDRLESMLLR